VKTLAFVIGLRIVAVGTVGILAPSGLVWIAHRADAPAALYVVAAIRAAFGVLLLVVIGLLTKEEAGSDPLVVVGDGGLLAQLPKLLAERR
jgi:hypothetical protein